MENPISEENCLNRLKTVAWTLGIDVWIMYTTDLKESSR